MGGLEGSKMSFLGPKPTQDPMNIVFEQKNFLGKKNFRDPRDPRPKKFSGPARAGPAGPAGSPKVVKIVPLGSLTLLKRTKHPMVHAKGGVDRPVTPPLAKVMTKTRFLASVGVFGLFWGPAGPMENTFFGLRWGFWPVLGASRPHGQVVPAKTAKN